MILYLKKLITFKLFHNKSIKYGGSYLRKMRQFSRYNINEKIKIYPCRLSHESYIGILSVILRDRLTDTCFLQESKLHSRKYQILRYLSFLSLI